jgi:hypothetical protein
MHADEHTTAITAWYMAFALQRAYGCLMRMPKQVSLQIPVTQPVRESKASTRYKPDVYSVIVEARRDVRFFNSSKLH